MIGAQNVNRVSILTNQSSSCTGHTRTISIPGCVKFNLSTNACRGFCMSFSIPTTEDVGSPLEQIDGIIEAPIAPSASFLGSSLTADDWSTMLKMKRRAGLTTIAIDSIGNNQNAADGIARPNAQLHEFLHLSGQTRSPLAGAVGDTSDKRDVISVGQCCNMMETEDVSTTTTLVS